MIYGQVKDLVAQPIDGCLIRIGGVHFQICDLLVETLRRLLADAGDLAGDLVAARAEPGDQLARRALDQPAQLLDPRHELSGALDADALNALSRLQGWPALLRCRAVLTPHPGELARLASSTVEVVQSERLAMGRRLASAPALPGTPAAAVPG